MVNPVVNNVSIVGKTVKVEFAYGINPPEVLELRTHLLALPQVEHVHVKTDLYTYLVVRPSAGTSTGDLSGLLRDLLRPFVNRPADYHLIRVMDPHKIGPSEVTGGYVCACAVFATPQADIEELAATVAAFANEHIGPASIAATGRRFFVVEVELPLNISAEDLLITDALKVAGIDATRIPPTIRRMNVPAVVALMRRLGR